jgi:hypothetical protein
MFSFAGTRSSLRTIRTLREAITGGSTFQKNRDLQLSIITHENAMPSFNALTKGSEQRPSR